MHHLFLALLCAAPLMMGYQTGEVSQPVSVSEYSVPAETVYLTCMGCDITDCTDPAHYHYCPADCADPAHYHNCPVGCQDAAHEHGAHHGGEYCSEPTFCPSMGCEQTGCTDPTHYHHCAADCTDPAHYHDCPRGCQNTAHPHNGGHHLESRGHHGGHH